jgi:hypothetical protein
MKLIPKLEFKDEKGNSHKIWHDSIGEENSQSSEFGRLETDIKKENKVEPKFIPRKKNILELLTAKLKEGCGMKKPLISLNHQKITVVGTHGWFPNKIFNKIVGEPRGTSQLLIEKTLSSLSEFPTNLMNVKCISLQGQGKVNERVTSYYETLTLDQYHLQTLRSSDQIIFTAHSQGCIVSTLLLLKLMQTNIITSSTRVGVIAIAGINHGPFHALSKSIVLKLESDPAHELFEYVSGEKQIEYVDSVKELTINFGVRFYYCGAWNDQVVPLFSGVFNNVNHPLIYRTVFVHHDDFNDDFLYHLCVFLIKIRNHGITDHGLLLYLSEYFKGSVYGFGTQGHSEVYEENETYKRGLDWILSEQTLWNGEFKVEDKVVLKYTPNHIPFALAQVFCNQMLEEKFPFDLHRLKELFQRWIPQGNFKELKYRMEPLRAKL